MNFQTTSLIVLIGLSAFASAQEKNDAIGCEAALESANAELTEVIMGLRALRPEDCSWQRRVSEAL